jgi:hypothetical protein
MSRTSTALAVQRPASAPQIHLTPKSLRRSPKLAHLCSPKVTQAF